MRITKTMMLSNMYYNLNKLQVKLSRHQMQIASNQRLLAPSDDPIGTSHALLSRTALAKNEQFQRNVELAANLVAVTDDSVNQLHSLLSDVEVLATKGCSGTYGEDERHSLATEVGEYLDSILQLSQTKFGGKYIFGGQQTKTAPFTAETEITQENFTAQADTAVELANVHIQRGSVRVTTPDGTTIFEEGTDFTVDYENGTLKMLSSGLMTDTAGYSIDYQTDSISKVAVNPNGIHGSINYQIGEGIKMQINVPGDKIFTNEVDIFNLLIDLKNKLERDDTKGVRALKDEIEKAANNAATINGEVGAKTNRLELTSNFLEHENLKLQDYKASEEELDIAEAMIKLQSYNMAYQAALTTSTEIMKGGLINFVKF